MVLGMRSKASILMGSGRDAFGRLVGLIRVEERPVGRLLQLDLRHTQKFAQVRLRVDVNEKDLEAHLPEDASDIAGNARLRRTSDVVDEVRIRIRWTSQMISAPTARA
jgi:hypothetical protein